MVPASEVPCSLNLSQGATGGYDPRHTGQMAALTASDRVWAMRRAWHSEGSRARLAIGLGQFQSGKAAQTRDEVACSKMHRHCRGTLALKGLGRPMKRAP